MTEREALPEVIERFLDQPVVAPPVEALRTAGAVAVRRRRRRAVTGAAAAALVVVGGVAVGQAALRGDHRDRADDTAVATTVDPPPGTRWAGIGRVVLAVPEDWADGRVGCANQPVADTVYFWDDAAPLCRPAYEPHSSLAISDHPFATLHGPGAHVDGQVDGHDVVVYGQLCAEPTVMSCGMDVSVPDLGAYFRITLHGTDVDEGLRTIRDTLTVLPENQVAVPPVASWRERDVDAAVDAMRDLGLRPRVEEGCPDGALCDLRAWSTPAAGTVVHVGDEVTIYVVGWGDGPDPYPLDELTCSGDQRSSGTVDVIAPSSPEEARKQDWPSDPAAAVEGVPDAPAWRHLGIVDLTLLDVYDDGEAQVSAQDGEGRTVLVMTVEELVEDAWALTGFEACG